MLSTSKSVSGVCVCFQNLIFLEVRLLQTKTLKHENLDFEDSFMDIKQRIGHFIEKSKGGESYKCYIPPSLPLRPPLSLESLSPLLERATVSLGALNGIRANLPSMDLFLGSFGRKEAVLSSQIEGTRSSLSDFLRSESESESAAGQDVSKADDITEVENYISAMEYGLNRINRLPLSRRLLCDIHGRLLARGRGSEKSPGEIRRSQNWIAGTRPGNAVFVPPPPENLPELLSDFEKFLHSKTPPLPVLIKTALAHVQFETIHPFLDGNGRMGRLLIVFMLCSAGILQEPLLYLSLYFKQNRGEYYRLLQSARVSGDWESWVEFFLKGVDEVSRQAFSTAQEIVALFKRDEERIKQEDGGTAGVIKTYNHLKRYPVSNTGHIVREANISLQTALRSLRALEKMGIVKEWTGRRRHKIFIYTKYVQIIDRGTEITIS